MEQLKESLVNSSCPVYFTRQDLIPERTGMNEFPYKKYYRGKAFSDESIVFDRKAGWNPVTKDTSVCPKDCSVPKPPVYCWQIPCNTVLPCHPKDPVERIHEDESALVRQRQRRPILYR